MADELAKRIAERLGNGPDRQIKAMRALVKSKAMAEALAGDDSLPPRVESLSERALPTITLRAAYARLLISNPARAQKLWDECARTVDELTTSKAKE